MITHLSLPLATCLDLRSIPALNRTRFDTLSSQHGVRAITDPNMIKVDPNTLYLTITFCSKSRIISAKAWSTLLSRSRSGRERIFLNYFQWTDRVVIESPLWFPINGTCRRSLILPAMSQHNGKDVCGLRSTLFMPSLVLLLFENEWHVICEQLQKPPENIRWGNCQLFL